jgi:hypothetical protein
VAPPNLRSDDSAHDRATPGGVHTGAATVTSRILIDPVGENNADFFGTSVAWVGDVNGDSYDDLLSQRR